MAYVNLVQQSCASWTEVVCRMRDFICKRNGTYDYSATGIGWTLHDESYSSDEDNPQTGDWYVVYSAGEDGKEDLYYRIKVKDATYITIEGYLYWDNSTHAGTVVINLGGSSFKCIQGVGTYSLSVYGNLDFVNVWELANDASYNYCTFFGRMDPVMEDNTVATCSSALTAGSDVSITLDAVPSTWRVGQKIFINDTTAIKFLTIKTIVDNVITADLALSWDAGSKLRAECTYCVNTSATACTTFFYSNHLTEASVSCSPTYNSTLLSYADAERMNDIRLLGEIIMAVDGSLCGASPNFYWVYQTGILDNDVFEDVDGNNYRHHKYYNNQYLAVLEV